MMEATGLDWGNVPGWVGSVLTGASLLLGFTILRRDRITASRDQASRLSVWTEPSNLVGSPFAAPEAGSVIIYNASTSFATEISFHYVLARDEPFLEEESGFTIDTPVMPPGGKLEVDLTKPLLANAHDGGLRVALLRVDFVDGKSVRWQLDLGTRILEKTPKKHYPKQYRPKTHRPT